MSTDTMPGGFERYSVTTIRYVGSPGDQDASGFSFELKTPEGKLLVFEVVPVWYYPSLPSLVIHPGSWTDQMKELVDVVARETLSRHTHAHESRHESIAHKLMTSEPLSPLEKVCAQRDPETCALEEVGHLKREFVVPIGQLREGSTQGITVQLFNAIGSPLHIPGEIVRLNGTPQPVMIG